MKKLILSLVAFAALAFFAFGELYPADDKRPSRVEPEEVAPAPAFARLPMAPADWHGRIDYRKLDGEFTALAERPEMAGLAVAIVEDGELRFVQTYGLADRDTGEPVMPETLFRWASLSKTVAGTYAGLLADEHRLDLNDPLSHWSTTLRLPEGANRRVTLAQLMAHQTGLTKNAYDGRLEAGDSPQVLRKLMHEAPLQCDPGDCHSYQNIAFDAASEIFEQATGEPYAAGVEQALFKPLSMKSACFGMDCLTHAKYWARPHHGKVVVQPVEAYWRVPAAAGVSSDIIDLARWMMAQMGEYPQQLSSRVLDIAHKPRVRTPRPYTGQLRAALDTASYGLGWRDFGYDGHLIEGHSGAVDGYRATMLFDPVTRTGVAAMWNSNWGLPFRIPFAVFDSYYGVDADNWLDLSDVRLPGGALPRADTNSPAEASLPIANKGAKE